MLVWCGAPDIWIKIRSTGCRSSVREERRKNERRENRKGNILIFSM
jgi:hypothetical protein